jgi:glutathione S-transferase
MSIHALLEDMGLPYEIRWVKIMVRDLDPDFQAASPHGRVPTLETPTGALFETGAIALWLAETHSQAELHVPEGDPDRGEFLQWLHYFASTLQPEVIIQFHPEFYFQDPETCDALKAASMLRLEKVVDTLEAALEPGPFFLGERRTILDYLFALQATWPEIYPTAIDDYPRIRRNVESLLARPAVKRIFDLNMEVAQSIDRSGMREV